MRQYELDLVKLLAPPPVLDGRCPAMTTIPKSVDKNDGCRVAARSGEAKRRWVVRHGAEKESDEWMMNRDKTTNSTEDPLEVWSTLLVLADKKVGISARYPGVA